MNLLIEYFRVLRFAHAPLVLSIPLLLRFVSPLPLPFGDLPLPFGDCSCEPAWTGLGEKPGLGEKFKPHGEYAQSGATPVSAMDVSDPGRFSVGIRLVGIVD